MVAEATPPADRSATNVLCNTCSNELRPGGWGCGDDGLHEISSPSRALRYAALQEIGQDVVDSNSGLSLVVMVFGAK